MKTSRLLIFIGFVAAIVALVCQAKTISELRAEVAGLRKDLQTSLESALDNAVGLPSEAAEARREKLELIKLRHQVRELNESAVGSHARERMANVRTIMHSLLPTSATSEPWKFRPEWKGMEALATNQYAQAMGTLASATNDYVRFLCLDWAAKMSLVVGRPEMRANSPRTCCCWTTNTAGGIPEKANGDVVYNGHMVLGRIALDEGRIEEAKRHLLASGKSNGSPVLGSFGPNMSLDKGLLDKGEQEAVLQHLELCRKFWRSDGGKLDEWTKDIQAGRIPNFGANLID